MNQLEDFTDAYIECAVWASTDDDGAPLDTVDAELSVEARETMAIDCEAFTEANAELLAQTQATTSG
jgi:hypothetical protein